MRTRAAFGRARARAFLPARRKRRSLAGELALAFIAIALLAWAVIDGRYVDLSAIIPEVSGPSDVVSTRFSLCAGAGGTCVIDGDTIRIEGQSIRIADIDTPEVRDYRCPEEKALGDRATRRMLELVNAGAFTMALWDHRDEDQYGRKLRVLWRDGQSLGMILVAEGLARPWDGARRSWCA